MTEEQIKYIKQIGRDLNNQDISIDILVKNVLDKWPNLDIEKVKNIMFRAIIGV